MAAQGQSHFAGKQSHTSSELCESLKGIQWHTCTRDTGLFEHHRFFTVLHDDFELALLIMNDVACQQMRTQCTHHVG